MGSVSREAGDMTSTVVIRNSQTLSGSVSTFTYELSVMWYVHVQEVHQVHVTGYILHTHNMKNDHMQQQLAQLQLHTLYTVLAGVSSIILT